MRSNVGSIQSYRRATHRKLRSLFHIFLPIKNPENFELLTVQYINKLRTLLFLLCISCLSEYDKIEEDMAERMSQMRKPGESEMDFYERRYQERVRKT